MINFLKKLFLKNKIDIAYSNTLPVYNNQETLMQINETIQSLEKRLSYIEETTWIEEPASQNKSLDQRFEKKISSFNLKEQDLIKLWIDKEILLNNKDIRLKDLPWHNFKSNLKMEIQNYWKTLRFLYLYWAIDKLFKFRKDNFTVIAGGLSHGNK